MTLGPGKPSLGASSMEMMRAAVIVNNATPKTVVSANDQNNDNNKPVDCVGWHDHSISGRCTFPDLILLELILGDLTSIQTVLRRHKRLRPLVTSDAAYLYRDSKLNESNLLNQKRLRTRTGSSGSRKRGDAVTHRSPTTDPVWVSVEGTAARGSGQFLAKVPGHSPMRSCPNLFAGKVMPRKKPELEN